jgi:hypothetical protein
MSELTTNVAKYCYFGFEFLTAVAVKSTAFWV